MARGKSKRSYSTNSIDNVLSVGNIDNIDNIYNIDNIDNIDNIEPTSAKFESLEQAYEQIKFKYLGVSGVYKLTSKNDNSIPSPLPEGGGLHAL